MVVTVVGSDAEGGDGGDWGAVRVVMVAVKVVASDAEGDDGGGGCWDEGSDGDGDGGWE